MKGKQLLFLIVALLVLGGAGLYLRRQDTAKLAESKLGMGGKVLGKFDLTSVAGVRIQSGTNQLNLAREGETWVVRERGGYPAGNQPLADLFSKLDELKVTRPLELGPSRLAALDLVEPDKGAGVQLDLLGADGKKLKSLLLGKSHKSGGGDDNSPMGGGGFPNGRYVMVDGDIKSVALVSEPLTSVDTRAEDWVSKDFFKVELPKRVEIVRAEATNSFTLSRTNEFAEWTLEGAKPEEKLDPAKVSLFGSILSAPTFTDVIVNPDLAALGLDKPVVARISTTAGFTYELKLGKAMENEEYAVQLAVTGDFPKERKAPEGEKPEDKDKADKEFKDKLAKNEDKLKKEQAYAKWTFKVSKWTLDALLKNRGDLMAGAKPEGAAPGEAPGAGGLPPDLLKSLNPGN